MTKTEAKADRKAFVTLRFAGDALDPRDISAILPVQPTRAHRKGEEFFAGPSAGTLRGRTGIWFLATDKLVDSDDLAGHLTFVQELLHPVSGDSSRIAKLRDILDRTHSHTTVTCFWRGTSDEDTPVIPAQFKAATRPLATNIETDFDITGAVGWVEPPAKPTASFGHIARPDVFRYAQPMIRSRPPGMPAVPAYDKLMWPALCALKAMGGSASNEELLNKVIEIENFPPEIQAAPHTQRETKLSYNLAWAKTYLKKAGAIDNSSRGVWSITKEGEGLTEEAVRLIPIRVRKFFDEAKRMKDAAVESETADDTGPASEPAVLDWKDHLLEVLKKLEPAAFERLAQRLLREAGFIKVEVTGRSGDGGIDGIGVLRVNLLSFQVLFQCKRYQGSVGAGAIRDFRGAMVGRSDKGLMITTGTFTPDAKREATRDGAPAIDLLDGDQLCDLLKQLKLGVRIELVEQMSVHPSFFDNL